MLLSIMKLITFFLLTTDNGTNEAFTLKETIAIILIFSLIFALLVFLTYYTTKKRREIVKK